MPRGTGTKKVGKLGFVTHAKVLKQQGRVTAKKYFPEKYRR